MVFSEALLTAELEEVAELVALAVAGAGDNPLDLSKIRHLDGDQLVLHPK